MHRVRSYGLLHPQHRSLLRQVQIFLPGTATGESPPDDQDDVDDNLIPESPRPRATLHCPHCGANLNETKCTCSDDDNFGKPFKGLLGDGG